jgi:hypothetical protein
MQFSETTPWLGLKNLYFGVSRTYNLFIPLYKTNKVCAPHFYISFLEKTNHFWLNQNFHRALNDCTHSSIFSGGI